MRLLEIELHANLPIFHIAPNLNYSIRAVIPIRFDPLYQLLNITANKINQVFSEFFDLHSTSDLLVGSGLI
jgi:hypothetical protein